MDIRTFQAKLDELGYTNAVSEPDPTQDFTVGKLGTLLWCDEQPQLEIRLPRTATRHARVRTIAVKSIEAMSDEIALAYIVELAKG